MSRSGVCSRWSGFISFSYLLRAIYFFYTTWKLSSLCKSYPSQHIDFKIDCDSCDDETRHKNYLTCTAAFDKTTTISYFVFFALDHGHLQWECFGRHDWFLQGSWLEWHWSGSWSSDSMDQVGNLWVSQRPLDSEMATCFDRMSVCAGRGGYASMAPRASSGTSQTPSHSDLFPRNFPLLVWPCRDVAGGMRLMREMQAALREMQRWLQRTCCGQLHASINELEKIFADGVLLLTAQLAVETASQSQLTNWHWLAEAHLGGEKTSLSQIHLPWFCCFLLVLVDVEFYF